MASLYELNEQMLAIDSILSSNTDVETGEILESARESLMQDIETKIENMLGYIAECKAKAEYYKGEIERITKKKKTLENRVDWLKQLIFSHLKSTGKAKGEYGTYTVAIGKSPDRVVISDDAVALLPDELCRIKREPDKVALKGLMTDGKYSIEIDGEKVVLARLETGLEQLRIK